VEESFGRAKTKKAKAKKEVTTNRILLRRKENIFAF